MQDYYEVRWHGRGGQGAITAAKILAQAAYLEGYHGVTAAPSFGAERRGAPVSASTRIARQTIRIVSQVETPNVVVVLDYTLLRYDEVTSGLVKGGWLVVNSRRHPKELDLGGEFNIATADATEVCSSLGLIVAGVTVVNTAILGAFIRATEAVSMASIEKAIRERFSDSKVDINLAAIAQTYKITKLGKVV
ncbi:MAG: 2-oxoacid:acceptor oxidoreductase family protein [Dehalococcoidia bacterium]|nr:2-oxoacid:acceptor oxidoreductase family protein [Dehalococcoidia bacterium]MDH4299940.1 2-oxoacid:acceptor oxidoreductase family protein [Dehalococcoidia bacterium]